MTFKTKITELLGIEKPIIQGGMQWVSDAILAAAVSNAGGLGTIAVGSFPDSESFQRELQKMKKLTDKPFAINMSIFPSLLPPNFQDFMKIAADEGVGIVETAGAAPTDFIEFMQKNGMTVIHKCTTIRHAKKAEAIGCNAIVIDGCECAGHPGENDIGSIVLTPRAVEELRVPVIACGGFSNGRGLAAALMLGAGAITMGTRFLVTQESGILPEVKKYLADNVTEMDTALIMRAYRNTTRVYNNASAREVLEIEKTGAGFDRIAPLVSGKKGRTMLYESADMDNGGMLALGLSIGLVHDIPTVQELLDRIIKEAEEAIRRYV